MTKTAAAALTSVLVPYFIPAGKGGKGVKLEAYRVTRVHCGYVVKGPRGEYNVTEHPDNFLACPCEGYAWNIEKNGEDLPAYCRHLVCIAYAQVEIAEIRAEAEDEQPTPAPRQEIAVMVDFDPFCEAA